VKRVRSDRARGNAPSPERRRTRSAPRFVRGLNHARRFRAVMYFELADRLPMIEWAGWWNLTLERWQGEGLSRRVRNVREHLGLDCYRQLWVAPRGAMFPYAAKHGEGVVESMDDYLKVRPHLYPAPNLTRNRELAKWARWQSEGRAVVWMTLDGFFWFPRTLLGIERHLLTFYEDPELMHQINSDLLGWNLRVVDDFCRVCAPQFMTLAEDMSYNHGPMCSKALFDEFLAPYYRGLVPALAERGILPMVDSDGDVTTLIPWLKEVGIQGILPLERMAGVDVAQIRRDHPDFRMIGAFDKMVMKRGEKAMRREFERLLPTMKTGGFIPSVDHQTPPDVSLETYRCYVGLLREYCERAASG